MSDPLVPNQIPYSLAPVSQRFVNFTSNMLWAEPDISHAASLMRYVYNNRQEALERARSGAELLKHKYSLGVIGHMAARRLRIIAGRVLGDRDPDTSKDADNDPGRRAQTV
jgi:hypothetical protein